MNINNSQFLSIEQLQDQYLKQQKVNAGNKTPQGMSFEEILHKQQVQKQQPAENVKFSKHAANRLSDRNIELTDKQLERLNDGTKKGRRKRNQGFPGAGRPDCVYRKHQEQHGNHSDGSDRSRRKYLYKY